MKSRQGTWNPIRSRFFSFSCSAPFYLRSRVVCFVQRLCNPRCTQRADVPTHGSTGCVGFGWRKMAARACQLRMQALETIILTAPLLLALLKRAPGKGVSRGGGGRERAEVRKLIDSCAFASSDTAHLKIAEQIRCSLPSVAIIGLSCRLSQSFVLRHV